MEPKPLSLEQVISILYLAAEDRAYYWDREEGCVVAVYDPFDADEADEETEALVAGNPDRFTPFPGIFEIGEEHLCQRFAAAQKDEAAANALLAAARSLHARTLFDAALDETCLRAAWEDFRTEEYEALARAWAEENGLTFEKNA